jgi:uncharacterized protein (DUF302 family)
MKAAFAALAVFLVAGSALAGPVAPRDGWEVFDTAKPYDALVEDLTAAIADQKMGLVTQAGPTAAAAKRGITIPGNRIFGVFRNDFAVRTLKTSVAAMIEAPIRFYVTEGADGKATLAYKTPSFVFSPYVAEGGEELKAIGAELDGIFAAIAADAID